MKLFFTLNIFIVTLLPAFAQVKCESITIWEIRLEGGKQIRTKYEQNRLCKDAKGNVVEQSEFGQGRELQYHKNEFDAQNRPIKEYYRHGYEGNDGGEGTITYQYVGNNKTIINYVAANFTKKTEVIETKNAKKQVIKRAENMTSKSEVLPDYNRKSKTIIISEYAKNDSLSKKIVQTEGSTTTELYQYEGNLRTRYEYKHSDGKQIFTHTVTKYKYDSLKRLIEERTLEMPKYITKSLIINIYKGNKLAEKKETSYTNFAENKISHQYTHQYAYDEKGELIKHSYAYFYGNQDKQTDETQYVRKGSTKVLFTTRYRNEEVEKRTKEVQIFEGEKLVKSEIYENDVLDYILEYEYEK